MYMSSGTETGIAWITSFPEFSYLCTQCGLCCKIYRIPVTDADRERLGVDDSYFVKNGNEMNIIKNSQGFCIFNKNGLCSVYEHRPVNCRLYPLDITVFQDGVVIDRILTCPNIGMDGTRIDADYINRIMREILPYLSDYTVSMSMRDYLNYIRKIEGLNIDFGSIYRANDLPELDGVIESSMDIAQSVIKNKPATIVKIGGRIAEIAPEISWTSESEDLNYGVYEHYISEALRRGRVFSYIYSIELSQQEQAIFTCIAAILLLSLIHI